MITAPDPVTFGSWLALGTESTTLFRSMENNLVKKIVLSGHSLDVGGGKVFDYVKKIKIIGQLDSVNIDAALQPTYVADLNKTLPFSDSFYDNVVCFNTLEHIYDESKLLTEIFRVLKPGGRFIITVPFLFKRHGRYGDFHRHSADYWEQVLVDQGFESKDFIVQPLVWCPLTSVLTSMPWFRGGLRGRALKLTIMVIELIRNTVFMRQSSRQDYKDWALGLYIEGFKHLSGQVESS